MMETIRVKFLRGTSLGNGRDAAPGAVIDLDRRLFAQFAQQGRVVAVDAPAEPAPMPEPSAAPTRKGRKNA
jgi:hypothetical protein